MSFTLTTEQHAAVHDRGGGLLVSAAAGSGKTRVLVERLLTRVADEGRNVDEFLIITYTRAAAAQLRSRIAEGLGERLAKSPMDRHLRRQTTLVYKAQISTIHAFCSVLLRENAHLLDISPDFRLCDEGEASVLMAQALGDVLDERYEKLEDDSDFVQLVDVMAAGRDDSRVVEIVLDIYYRIQSHPNPRRWLGEQEAAFDLDGVADAGDTAWGGLLLGYTERTARYWVDKIRQAWHLAQKDEKLRAAYAPSLNETAAALDLLCGATAKGWDAASSAADIPFPRFGQVRGGCDDPDAQERVKAIRDRCKKQMVKVKTLFQDSSSTLMEDIRTVRPAMRGLFALVRDFASAYYAEKNRRGLLDFSDLEHQSLRLLVGEDGHPTETAALWAGRYAEIMVDEYQDTNEVQNAIFTALSRGEQNLFMVGDVKQSIYRFRLADPTIFLRKYNTFKPYTSASAGESRSVTLTRNFRSRREVLASVNDLFEAVMSADFGEMDYTERERLVAGGDFPEQAGCATEFNVIDCGQQGIGEDGKTDKNFTEARFAAARIRQMLDEGFPVSDGEGGTRPVRPGDIVILLRSPGTSLHHYTRALTEQELPWQAEAAEDFFASAEVSVALSFLQIADNPRQDIALISVLRSPVYGFDGDRLAELRAGGEGDFYSALEAAAERGEEDCAVFLKELERLRLMACDLSSHGLLWQIYERTNLPALFSALRGGQARRDNLYTLYELARQFESTGHRGLFGFLSHLNRLRESGVRISASGGGGETGGISILSIHRSKGLEFPVVLLCGLAKRFNREDMRRPVLFHPGLGVGPRAIDRERMVQYTTLPRLAVAMQLESEMMAEELRLLYVAMTRAQEKLIMTYTLGTGAGELVKLREDIARPVAPQALAACASAGQWVLLALMSRPEAAHLRQAAGMQTGGEPETSGAVWDIRLANCACWHTPPARLQKGEDKGESLSPDLGLAGRLTWENPYKVLSDVPSKITATQLKGRFMDEEAAEETGPSRRDALFSAQRPRFTAEKAALTPAERGVAVHLAMQHIDFEKTGSLAEIELELDRLATLLLITPEQRQAVPPEKILSFFASETGAALLGAKTVHREFKFSLLVPACEYYDRLPPDEELLMQGVIDCWFETRKGITLVDFKTDAVVGDALMLRAKEYRPQVEAYSRALESITGKKVRRRILWFFSSDSAVEI